MALTVTTNLASLQSQLNLSQSQNAMGQAIGRLSSGLRINTAADDAAGLAISDRMTAQIQGQTDAVRNANDAVSLAQTSESGLRSILSNLQNMRTLAVQAANGTNTLADQISLNQQFQQNLQSIQTTSDSTQFNGASLLNGENSAINIQVGANAGQTLGMQFAAATTHSLGSYGGTGSAVKPLQGFTSSNAIAINGVTIGASTGSDSTHGLTADSAAAKAAAINMQTQLTGVTASAETLINLASPSASSLNPVNLSDQTITLNGVGLQSISGSSAVQLGQSFASAINAVSDQTGVFAKLNASNGALTVSAADGRDIVFGDTSASQTNANLVSLGVIGTNADATPLTFSADANINTVANISGPSGPAVYATTSVTLSGKISLFSPQTFSLTNAYGVTALDDAGLNLVGTYQYTLPGFTINPISSIAWNGSTNGIFIDGTQIGATQAVNGGLNGITNVSALARANAINAASAVTQVSAFATTSLSSNVTGITSLPPLYPVTTIGANQITLNGVYLGVISGNSNNGVALSFANAVNAVSGSTGVSASIQGNQLSFYASDGRDIIFGDKSASGSHLSTLGLPLDAANNPNILAAINRTSSAGGSLSFYSVGQLTMTGTGSGLSDIGYGEGLESQAPGVIETVLDPVRFTEGFTEINSLSIANISNANTTLNVLDTAINQVDTARGNLGAYQNELNAVITHLQGSSIQLQTGQSRIRDTDFASETANLSGQQILQQAGTAMLTQANTLPNSVLSLLKQYG